ncbi:hypothetical protein DFH28DRAFT_936830 [Melampsora americana]|nr:hypothetical protein DFH28DRAFT_936830 [Melampsora americana]
MSNLDKFVTSRSLALIDCLQEQSHLGHQSDNYWKPIAWTATVDCLSLKFPPGYDIAHIENHYTLTTSQFRSVCDRKNTLSTGCNEEEQSIVANAAFWTNWHISHRNACQWEKKGYPLYHALDTLIGHVAVTGSHCTGTSTSHPRNSEYLLTKAKKDLDDDDSKDDHHAGHGWNPETAPESNLHLDLQNNQNTPSTQQSTSSLTQPIITQPTSSTSQLTSSAQVND